MFMARSYCKTHKYTVLERRKDVECYNNTVRSNPDIAPFVVQRDLWQYIQSRDKS